MTETTDGKNAFKWIVRILTIGVILVNIKNIFTNFNIDAEYAIAMSYRMVKGDSMFSQMWEPHQTSGFLMALFIKLYLVLFQTTTGLAVYLNAVGLVLKVVVTAILYNTLRKSVNSKVLYLGCLFFLAVNPKNMLLPEFSNMQLWFSVLLFCFLFVYLQNQNQKKWLLGVIIALCLEALAYPASVFVFVGVAVILFIYSEKKWQDILLVTGGCFVAGSAYIGYFVARMGLSCFVEAVRYIISGDKTHSAGVLQKWGAYFVEIGKVAMLVGICATIAVVLVLIISAFKKIKSRYWFLTLWAVCLCVYHLGSTLMVGDRYMYLSLFVVILVVAIWACRFCDSTEKQIYVLGAIISGCNLFATLILTNLTFLTSIAYLVLGVTLAFIPISKACESLGTQSCLQWRYGVLLLFCMVTIIRSGFLIRAMQEENTSVLDVMKAGGIVRSGPAVGLISDYMGPYVMNSSMAEWEQYIHSGDRVLIVGSEKVSTIGYLYEDTEICVDSTICTPTYDEKLLKYWEQNPQKYPNVVVVSCWFGELKVAEDSWIMQWLETEFRADTVIDGQYYRYYLKNES